MRGFKHRGELASGKEGKGDGRAVSVNVITAIGVRYLAIVKVGLLPSRTDWDTAALSCMMIKFQRNCFLVFQFFLFFQFY